jgi:hypothetical protein
MADEETNAVIVLDTGKPLKVQSTVKQINAEIEGRKNLTLPMIPVVDEHGREVWINANHIIAFQEYESEGMPLLRFA